MIPAGVVQCSRLSVSIRTDAGNLLCQMLNGFDQAAVATQAEQHTMKTDVAVEHRQQVAGINRLAVLTLYRLEAGDIRLRHRKRQDAHRHDLKQLAYVVNLRHLRGVRSRTIAPRFGMRWTIPFFSRSNNASR